MHSNYSFDRNVKFRGIGSECNTVKPFYFYVFLKQLSSCDKKV